MAKRIRKPPSVADHKDFRAREAFDADVEDMLRRVGSVTADVGSIAAGGVATVSVPVPAAKPDIGQTVEVGVPSALGSSIIAWGVITANETVSVYLHNRTGSPVDPASGLYSARVLP